MRKIYKYNFREIISLPIILLVVGIYILLCKLIGEDLTLRIFVSLLIILIGVDFSILILKENQNEV